MRRPVSISGKLIVVNDGFGETVLHREISVNVSTGVWSQALLQSHRAGLSRDSVIGHWRSERPVCISADLTT
ncbi:hypothetical protein [Primorskyibacter sp. S87]|uniref:hypothetical protein n=1 Tax=Primorskyibacter sp. S87 TaxID=3415126 RepID=UPI003C7CF9E7